MRKALAGKPAVDFLKPDTVVSVSIDPATGCPAKDGTLKKRDEFYLSGTEPTESCTKSAGAEGMPLTPPKPDVQPSDTAVDRLDSSTLE
jgi:membrane carboxypeptidase/penicillin-binding protein